MKHAVLTLWGLLFAAIVAAAVALAQHHRRVAEGVERLARLLNDPQRPVVLVFAVIGIFAWALHRGQFDDLDREGERILAADDGAGFPGSGNVDSDQARE